MRSVIAYKGRRFELILDRIVAHKELEVKQQKQEESQAELEEKISQLDSTRDFNGALSAAGMGLIAEIKRASPSKGMIREDFKPVEIAKEYQRAGANALSILTDQEFFQGELAYLEQAREVVELPLLRKDFIIDSYQIYQARAYGADAILLIAAILTAEELARYLKRAEELGLDVLVEVHNQQELEMVLELELEIIGINNRDLKVFEVDLETTIGLKSLIPEDKVVVSESGIQKRADVQLLAEQGVDGVLVGEALMRSHDLEAKVRELVG
ncbi:indole-3-glycerol phosphate synthase TrpC [Natroniella acetigena]|uniref:indole-3-glycerol phosphate synthase TrpC n=1 Tax=Natroniella acetigena TaxID=52004 RepID=UPI00200B97DA|nr:indole-3-glycerol phosphate synthase TrpC [Natroniella acetigena]MCK8828098.1 indole-3-glycerol phosphate synthase TrpC [Natroniella acetigena]